MKKIILLILALATPLMAQVSNPSIILVTNAPSGSCGSGLPMEYIFSTGVLYGCDNGTWATLATGGGGGGNPAPPAFYLQGSNSTSTAFSSDSSTNPFISSQITSSINSVINVKAPPYNAKGDGVLFDDCVITATQNIATCAAETFSSADIGKIFELYGAGTSSGLLVTTISGFTSTHVVTLTATAGTTVSSNGRGLYGSDNATALAAAKAACPTTGCTFFVPTGIFVTSAQFTIPQSYTWLTGTGMSSQLAYAGASVSYAFGFVAPGTPDTSCSTATGCIFRDGIEDLILRGNSNATVTLYTYAMLHSTFSNVKTLDAGTDNYESVFGVANHHSSFFAGAPLLAGSPQNFNGDALYSSVNGIHLSSISSSGGVSGGGDWHGTFVSTNTGCGVLLDGSLQNGFFGGVASTNGTGICTNASTGSVTGSNADGFYNWDVEQNTTYAANINGEFGHFDNLYETAGGALNVGASAQYNSFYSGAFSQGCTIASGALDTHIMWTDCAPYTNSSLTTSKWNYPGTLTLPNGVAIDALNSSGTDCPILTALYSDNNVYLGSPSGANCQTGALGTVIRGGNANQVTLSAVSFLSAATTAAQFLSVSGTGTATFAAGAAAGSSPGTPACVTNHVCDSISGTVQMATGGSGTTTGVALTVTTTITRTNFPNCSGAAYLQASPYTALPLRISTTATTVVFNVGGTPSTATTYEFTYNCGGR